MQRIIEHPELGKVTVRKTPRSRRISIRVNPRRGVTVTIPWYCSYRRAEAFLTENKEWVLKTIARQQERLAGEGAISPEETERLRKEAKAWLPARLAFLAERYSFSYNQVRIKNNVSNWGSCSRKGNINLNLHIMRLPEDLRDYVILHELCHLRVPDHGPEFHSLLESLCPDHRKKEKELRKYRIF